MSEQVIKFPRTSDHTIFDVFSYLGKTYEITTVSASALGHVNLGSINLKESPNQDWLALLNYNSYLINTLSITIHGLSIVYYRGGNQEINKKSPIYDEILLRWHQPQNNQPTLSNKNKLDIISHLYEKLRPFDPERVAGRYVSEEDGQIIAIHHNTLERLERLNEDLVRQTVELRDNFEKRINDSLQQNNEALVKQREILEEELLERKKGLEEKYSGKLRKIEEERITLQEKIKKVDDRNNTHVRREIRDKMLSDVNERIHQFGVSPGTERKRKPVAVGIGGLAMIFMFFLMITSYEIMRFEKEREPNILTSLATPLIISKYAEAQETVASSEKIKGTKKLDSFVRADISKPIQKSTELGSSLTVDEAKKEEIQEKPTANVDNTPLYFLWIRFTLFSFGLIGTLLYYIKWQNKWAEQHALSEFQLQQFYLDINRSNWVIESCLEWQKENDSTIPDVLLSSITNHLFSRNDAELERVIHPADELASALMGSASKLKLKIGDNEVEYDNPKKISNKPIITKGNDSKED